MTTCKRDKRIQYRVHTACIFEYINDRFDHPSPSTRNSHIIGSGHSRFTNLNTELC